MTMPDWFNKHGLLYTPKHPAGWALLIVVIALSAYYFVQIDARSHSASDTLINWMARNLLLALVYTAGAGLLTSQKKSV